MLPEKRQVDNLKMAFDMPFEEEFAIGNLTEESMVCGYYFPQSLKNYFEKAVLFQSKDAATKWQKKWLWFIKKVGWLNSHDYLLLKSPYNIARIEEILEIFPNAQFIHLHRNPIEVYASSKYLLEKSLPELALQKWDDQIVEKFVIDSYVSLMEKFINTKKLILDNHLIEISYASLISDPMSVIDGIYKQFNLDLSDDAVMKIKRELDGYKNYKSNSFTVTNEERQQVKLKWMPLYRKMLTDVKSTQS